MRFDVTRGHALGVHGQNLFLNILTDTDLVLLQDLGLKFAFPITRYRHFHIAKAGPQCFAAVTVAAVVRVLIFVVILAVAKFIIQLCLQAVFHELGNGFLEQALDVLYAAYVRQLQPFSVFSRRAFSSGGRFFLAIIKTSNVVLLFYTTSEVYTKFGMVSKISMPCIPRVILSELSVIITLPTNPK